MTTDNKDIWIKAGYKIFAHSGYGAIKIEPLSKIVGKSKSSFYHYFADLEIFTDCLLQHHIRQSKVIAQKEQNAKSIDPELIQVLVEHKTDLLFNRQLRINQNITLFASTLEKSNKIVGDAFLNVWVKNLNHQLTKKQIEGIYSLALQNFFLQINTETLTYEWLSTYFKQLNTIAGNLA